MTDSTTGPALVFDLDGTLVDTAPDLLSALNAILEREGRYGVDVTTLRHLVGHGARALIAEAFRTTGSPAVPERLLELTDAFIAYYGAHLAEQSRPFDGVEETLTLLKAQGARLGVLTNKPQILADPLLKALNMTRYFGAVHGAGRYEYVKPDARVFKHVVDDLGGGPATMIGDSLTDLKTARAAGVPIALVSFGYTPEPAHSLGADAVVDRFSDIPDALRGLGML